MDCNVFLNGLLFFALGVLGFVLVVIPPWLYFKHGVVTFGSSWSYPPAPPVYSFENKPRDALTYEAEAK